MLYETKGNRHGLPHDPYKSCIVPRPIGWISTKPVRKSLVFGTHRPNRIFD